MVRIFFGSGGPASSVPSSSGAVRKTARTNILFQPLSPSQWRVIDPRLSESDARSLLGFIEEIDHLFEVMQLGDGVQVSSFSSLADALDCFSTEADGSTVPDREPSLTRL